MKPWKVALTSAVGHIVVGLGLIAWTVATDAHPGYVVGATSYITGGIALLAIAATARRKDP